MANDSIEDYATWHGKNTYILNALRKNLGELLAEKKNVMEYLYKVDVLIKKHVEAIEEYENN